MGRTCVRIDWRKLRERLSREGGRVFSDHDAHEWLHGLGLLYLMWIGAIALAGVDRLVRRLLKPR